MLIILIRSLIITEKVWHLNYERSTRLTGFAVAQVVAVSSWEVKFSKNDVRGGSTSEIFSRYLEGP